MSSTGIGPSKILIFGNSVSSALSTWSAVGASSRKSFQSASIANHGGVASDIRAIVSCTSHHGRVLIFMQA